jgi:hypothetical protein
LQWRILHLVVATSVKPTILYRGFIGEFDIVGSNDRAAGDNDSYTKAELPGEPLKRNELPALEALDLIIRKRVTRYRGKEKSRSCWAARPPMAELEAS